MYSPSIDDVLEEAFTNGHQKVVLDVLNQHGNPIHNEDIFTMLTLVKEKFHDILLKAKFDPSKIAKLEFVYTRVKPYLAIRREAIITTTDGKEYKST